MQSTGYLDVIHELSDNRIQLLKMQSPQGDLTLMNTQLHTHTLENQTQTFHRLRLIQVILLWHH
jgi:hypothetical protein